MKKHREWLEWLTFSKRERNGILVLCTVLVGLLCYNYIDSKRIPVRDDAAFLEQRQKVIAWMQQPDFPSQIEIPEEDFSIGSQGEKKTPPSLFVFDPNHLHDSLWLALGLSHNQINGIRRFEEKGGVFRI